MSKPLAPKQYDVIVLGGGAAGLMAAMTAGARGKQVLVIECSNKLGKKILMSGGGRCNFTNLDVTPDNFISQNPHFFKSAYFGKCPGVASRFKSTCFLCNYLSFINSRKYPTFHTIYFFWASFNCSGLSWVSILFLLISFSSCLTLLKFYSHLTLDR